MIKRGKTQLQSARLRAKQSPSFLSITCVLAGIASVATLFLIRCTFRSEPDFNTKAQVCRDEVFTAKGQGGQGTFPRGHIESTCRREMAFNVCDDLLKFTGLSKEEMILRMRRLGHFHFEGEHLFWNPQTTRELAWYYSTSTDYLFANALHLAQEARISNLTKAHEPVLEYSGGVGQNVLYLAEKGIRTEYFGIGLIEKSFAQFRVNRRGLDDLVTFRSPWTAKTNWTFDPINAALPRDASLGGILAIDVLEHIPKYHKVVEAMVDSLRVGGVIVEATPFGSRLPKGQVDTRVHVSDGGVPLSQAMGPRMQYDGEKKWWEKVKEG